MILAALMLIAQQGPNPPHGRTFPPGPARANLVSYFSIADYPPDALAARRQGWVGVRLNVGANGRVQACAVTASSGSASLDRATCPILLARARFTPARDEHGFPRPDIVDTRINWTLPPAD